MEIRRQANVRVMLAAIAAFLASSLSAQVLEEVVVTAQKREQNLQDVGIAITAFSGDQLSQLGLGDPEELDMHVPGLMVTDFGNSYTSVYTLRGSTQLDFADHHEPPVAVYMDGAYNSFLGAVGMSYYDVGSVEVLKGPQGTLFGRNATGGVVHMTSARPTREFEGFAEIGGGEFGLIQAEAAVSGPITEKVLSGRVSVLYKEHSGFMDDKFGPVQGNLVEQESRNFRGQLLFDISEDTSLLLQGRWNDENDSNTMTYHTRAATLDFPQQTGADLFAFTSGISGLLGIPNDPNFIIPGVGQQDGLVRQADPTSQTFIDGCSHPQSIGFHSGVPGAIDCWGTIFDDGDPFTVDGDILGSYDRQYWGITGTFETEIDPFRFVNIMDYQSLQKFYVEDTDGGPTQTLQFDQFVDTWQFSNEFRVHWETENTRWVAGVYYLHIEGEYRSGLDLRDGLGFFIDNEYDNETDSYAIFAQGEWDITPQVTVIGGIRWTEDEKNASLNANCSFDIFGDPDCSVILMPLLGFGSNATSPAAVQTTGYDLSREEGDYAMKLEIDYRPNDDWLLYAGVTRGNKAGGFNAGSVTLYSLSEVEFTGETLWSYEGGFKASLFDNTRVNATMFYYDYQDFQTFAQFGPSLKVFNIDVEVLGAEVEVVTNPWDGWEFMFGLSWLDAQVQDLAFGIFVEDADMTNAPDISLNGMARYEFNAFNGTMAAQLDFNYVDDRSLNAIPHPAYIAEDYFIANARVSYTTADEKIRAALWIKNFTDEEYFPTVFDLATFTGNTIDVPGKPFWFGGSVRYTFGQ